jgi:hypothetical protein
MVTYVLLLGTAKPIMDLLEYLDEKGRSPFEKWFNRINAQAAVKVSTALVRLESGNASNTKSVGGGVYELKLIMVRVTGFISAMTALKL